MSYETSPILYNFKSIIFNRLLHHCDAVANDLLDHTLPRVNKTIMQKHYMTLLDEIVEKVMNLSMLPNVNQASNEFFEDSDDTTGYNPGWCSQYKLVKAFQFGYKGKNLPMDFYTKNSFNRHMLIFSFWSAGNKLFLSNLATSKVNLAASLTPQAPTLSRGPVYHGGGPIVYDKSFAVAELPGAGGRSTTLWGA